MRPMNDRLFPARPILAVSAAVFRDGRVLIVRRARAPLIGHFSLPGGVVEIGETLAEAVARELMEEVGVSAEIIGFNRHLDAIARVLERHAGTVDDLGQSCAEAAQDQLDVEISAAGRFGERDRHAADAPCGCPLLSA